MATPAFQFLKSANGSKPMTIELELEASTTLNDGDACLFSANGKVQKVSNATDKPTLIAAGPCSSSATGGEKGIFMFSSPLNAIWRCSFTPVVNKATASGGSTTTATVAVQSFHYTSNQLQGGTLFVKESSQTPVPNIANSTIGQMLYGNNGHKAAITASTDNTSGGGNSTLTVTTPMQATMNALTISATNLGIGSNAVQLATTFDGPSQDPSKQSSGFLRVVDVDPEKGTVDVMFLP